MSASSSARRTRRVTRGSLSVWHCGGAGRDGGTGRHGGLKNLCPRGRAGSSPAPGTESGEPITRSIHLYLASYTPQGWRSHMIRRSLTVLATALAVAGMTTLPAAAASVKVCVVRNDAYTFSQPVDLDGVPAGTTA